MYLRIVLLFFSVRTAGALDHAIGHARRYAQQHPLRDALPELVLHGSEEKNGNWLAK